MKVALIGLDDLPVGKRNIKDPRLDRLHELVEAKKKVAIQADIVGAAEAADADVLIVLRGREIDLLVHDLEFVELRLGRDPAEVEARALGKLQAALEAERFGFQVEFDPEETTALQSGSLLTTRPVLIAAAATQEAVDDLLPAAFGAAGNATFLTVGGKENRAWPIRRGATAWEAAGVVHTDIQKGFIRAEIIAYDELVAAGGETEAKRAGKMRLEMKDYVMRDYDIANFRFNKR